MRNFLGGYRLLEMQSWFKQLRCLRGTIKIACLAHNYVFDRLLQELCSDNGKNVI
jgi:hypothetical protein